MFFELYKMFMNYKITCFNIEKKINSPEWRILFLVPTLVQNIWTPTACSPRRSSDHYSIVVGAGLYTMMSQHSISLARKARNAFIGFIFFQCGNSNYDILGTIILHHTTIIPSRDLLFGSRNSRISHR